MFRVLNFKRHYIFSVLKRSIFFVYVCTHKYGIEILNYKPFIDKVCISTPIG